MIAATFRTVGLQFQPVSFATGPMCHVPKWQKIIFMHGTVDLRRRGGHKQECHASYAASHKHTNNHNHSNIIQVISLTDCVNFTMSHFNYGLQNVNTCKTSE